MKKHAFSLLLGLFPLAQSCSNAQCQIDEKELSAVDFSKKMAQCPDAVVLDVRTAEEFASGRLEKAVNIDWNAPDFSEKTAALDRSKPVFVYCLSGGRSAAAAQKMRADGFGSVVEMQGGVLKWRAAKLPLASGAIAQKTGMSQADFDALLKTDKLVLVDFYAEWCVPCKKMAPFLEEIKTEMAEKVALARIDVDQNPAVAKTLNVDALPTLLIYKNGQPVWRRVGFAEKSEIAAKLGSF